MSESILQKIQQLTITLTICGRNTGTTIGRLRWSVGYDFALAPVLSTNSLTTSHWNGWRWSSLAITLVVCFCDGRRRVELGVISTCSACVLAIGVTAACGLTHRSVCGSRIGTRCWVVSSCYVRVGRTRSVGSRISGGIGGSAG